MFPAFRDWIVPPFYFNQNGLQLTISSVEQNLYNILVQVIPGPIVVYSYSILWLIFSLYIAYKSFNLLHNYFFSYKANIYFIGILSVFYTINLWTVERLLMGQIHVLRGHFLLPITFYIYLKSLKNPIIKNILTSMAIILLLGFVSVHHLYFLVLIGVVYTLYFIATKGNLKKNYLLGLTSIIQFIPAIIYTFINLAYSNQSSVFQSSFGFQQVNKNEVIESFSLKINEFIGIDNIVSNSLLGSGSWMNNTFFEYFDIKNSLGIFKFAFPMYNPLLAYLFTGLMVIAIGWFFSISQKNKDGMNIFGVIAVITLILNFGYSNSLFKSINQVFYLIPSTYVLREPGKFYSVFLMLFVIMTFRLSKESMSKAFFAIISLFTFLNVIFGIVVVSSLNLKNHPDILAQTNTYCKEEEINKSIYLPNQTYLQSKFSGDIFIENYWYMASNCGFIKSEFSTIGPDSKAINYKEVDIDFNQAINNYNCENKFNEFVNTYDIDLIVIDTAYYPKLVEFMNCENFSGKLILSDKNILVFRYE